MSCKRNINLAEKNNKPPLLRLLCLHGYRQNEMAFRERSGGLRKFLKNQAEFVFCEAPHPVATNEQATAEEASNEAGKAWWFSSPDSTYNASDITNCDNGFDASLQYINSVFESDGPFDGLYFLRFNLI
jgi:hypothetical protein